MRHTLTILAALLLPIGAFAAPAHSSFSVAPSLLAASSSPGNAYAAGMSVVLTAPVTGDLLAFGGSIVSAAPVSGDDLLLAGSIRSSARVSGDLRAMGGGITVDAPVGGDLAAFGFSINAAGHVGGSVFIAGANVTLSGGAAGPVTIYGNNIVLGGTFGNDVTVVASGHFSVQPGTVIRGKLAYQAPEKIVIPEDASINSVVYTSISYLPDAGTSRTLAFMSIGLFLIARIVGALILAGLLAGLFPRFAETLTRRAYTSRPLRTFLTFLLGFGVLVATPIVIALLLLTFVGFAIAALLAALYLLLILLAFVYAGILTGALFAHKVLGREVVLWHDGVLGMLALSIVALIPYIGLPVMVVLVLYALGALLRAAFSFLFPHES